MIQSETGFIAVESRFFVRVFQVFSILALLSLGINLIGREVGGRLSMGGHSDDEAIYEVVIGNDVLSASANHIRYPEQRRGGVAARLDLYAIWPGMQGFSEANRAAFNNANPGKPLIFLSFEQRALIHDMSGRLEPIYDKMFKAPPEELPNGLLRYALMEESGFAGESIFVGQRDDLSKFVARCLDPQPEQTLIAHCIRDVHVGDNIAMTVRFPSALLDEWPTLDRAINSFAAQTVKAASN